MASCSPKGLLLESSFMAKAGPLAGPSKELCEPYNNIGENPEKLISRNVC